MEQFRTFDNGAQMGAHPQLSPNLAVNGYPTPVSIKPNFSLSTEHREQLEKDSAISPETIKARGYFTIPNDSSGSAWLKSQGFSSTQCKLGRALGIPQYNARGEIAGYQIRPDIPRNDSRGKPIKYEVPAKSSPLLDFSVLNIEKVNDAKHDLILTEGAKKADSAASRGFCAVSVNGVSAIKGRSENGSVSVLSDFHEISYKWQDEQGVEFARVVYIAFDSDIIEKDSVYNALRNLATAIENRKGSVKVIEFKPGPNGEKTGLDDFFARGGTVHELKLLAHDLIGVAERDRRKKELKREQKREKIAAMSQARGVPEIEVSDRQLPEILTDLGNALVAMNAKTPRVFHGADGLTTIIPDKDGNPVLQSIGLDAMQGIAGDAAHWISTGERGYVTNVFPSRNTCGIFLHSREKWLGIPPIDSVVNAPFFDAKGKLCATNGYYREAQAWLQLPEGFVIGDTNPTPENIAAAKEVILNTVMGEIAFSDEASRAHHLALTIQPLVRRLIKGGTPLYLYDAPVQSSGKSYAASLAILPHTLVKVMDEMQEKSEWEKTIGTAFLEGRSHLFFDNIVGKLNSSSLASFMTEQYKTQRLLGLNKTVTFNTFASNWVATSNNAILSADSISRIVKIRIDTKMESPDAREYKGDPKAFINENRALVMTALITLVNHWKAQGCPAYRAKKHRFSQWSQIVGGILEACEIHGFLENLEAERDNMAPDRDAWRSFVISWFETHGENALTAKDLLETALKCEGMKDLIGEKDSQTKRLGDLLSRRKDQIFADLQIVKAAERSKNGVKWRLLSRIPIENGDAGVTGDAGLGRHTQDDIYEEIQEIENNALLSNNYPESEQGYPASPVTPASPETDLAVLPGTRSF